MSNIGHVDVANMEYCIRYDYLKKLIKKYIRV